MYVTRGSNRIEAGVPGCKRKVLGIRLGAQGNEVVVRLLEDDPCDTVGWRKRGQVGRWSVSCVSRTSRPRVIARAEIRYGSWWYIDTDDEAHYLPKKDLGPRPSETRVMMEVDVPCRESLVEWKLVKGYGARLTFSRLEPTPWQVFKTKSECRRYLNEVYDRCLLCTGEVELGTVCPTCVKNLSKKAILDELHAILCETEIKELLAIPGLIELTSDYYWGTIIENLYSKMVDDEAIRVEREVEEHDRGKSSRAKKT